MPALRLHEPNATSPVPAPGNKILRHASAEWTWDVRLRQPGSHRCHTDATNGAARNNPRLVGSLPIEVGLQNDDVARVRIMIGSAARAPSPSQPRAGSISDQGRI